MMDREPVTPETSPSTQIGVLENLGWGGQELKIALPEANEEVKTINAVIEDVHGMEARMKMKLLRSNSKKRQ